MSNLTDYNIYYDGYEILNILEISITRICGQADVIVHIDYIDKHGQYCRLEKSSKEITFKRKI